MNGSRHRHRTLAALALGVLTVGACGSDATLTKAGGDREPVVLRFGTDEFPGRPGADQIDEFGRIVAELTDGEVRIEGVWEAGRDGDGRQWDQRVARKVIDGELDGGNIPARAWDLMGVTSMQVLHAPFLVTDEGALHEVLSDEAITADMLDGLEGTGVTGLAIAPDSIRYLFGFREPFPLTTAAGFDGALIRAAASATTWATFQALGATPDDMPDFDAAIADGSLVAMESSFGTIDSAPNTVALGNLPLFPKANVLVVNDDVLDRLDDDQRDALFAAAEATRDWAIANSTTAAEAAAGFCTGEGSIVHADSAEIDAIHERAESALAELATDGDVAAAIDRIRAVVDGHTPGTGPAACAPPAAPATEPPAFDVAQLTGTYRFPISADDMRAAGVSESWIERNQFFTATLVTITFGDGTVTVNDHCESCATVDVDVVGTYTVSGSDVTIRIDDWASHWVMSPTFTDDGITWTYVDSLAPFAATAEDKLVDETFWTTHPWTRVG